jgi:hypothetical protein
MSALLAARGLRTIFDTDDGADAAVDGVGVMVEAAACWPSSATRDAARA